MITNTKDAIFEDKLLDVLTTDADLEYVQSMRKSANYDICQDCYIPMVNYSSCYECPQCGIVKDIIGSIEDCSTESKGSLLRVGRGKQKITIGSFANPEKTQQKVVEAQLYALNEASENVKFSPKVLNKAVEIYTSLQTTNIQLFDNEGNANGQKRVVKRGNIKDEILGACIYYAGIMLSEQQKRRHIADFMNLSTQGFSHGETELRWFHNQGKINIPINSEDFTQFIDRYMTSLGLIDRENMTDIMNNRRNFVIEIIQEAVKLGTGKSSMVNSKIAGAIWSLVCHTQSPDYPHKITINDVEHCCDKIRKTTFTKFSDQILEHKLKLLDVFIRNNIPHGIRGRIVRKST